MLGGDGLGFGERRGHERVVGQQIHLAWQALGGLEDGLLGGGLEEGQVGARQV